MNPTEIASKEFPVVMRGYLREEVQAFLAGISDQIAARDNRIAQLDAEVARLKEQAAAKPAPAPTPRGRRGARGTSLAGLDRPALLKQLGEEAANILACADASAERIKAQAGITTERVRTDLRTIGSSLTDVHQLLGELISLVQGLTEGANLLAATAAEGNPARHHDDRHPGRKRFRRGGPHGARRGARARRHAGPGDHHPRRADRRGPRLQLSASS